MTIPKWTEGMAQVAEYLLCRHKALSPNPITSQKINTK
jgi:hypothetical protein